MLNESMFAGASPFHYQPQHSQRDAVGYGRAGGLSAEGPPTLGGYNGGLSGDIVGGLHGGIGGGIGGAFPLSLPPIPLPLPFGPSAATADLPAFYNDNTTIANQHHSHPSISPPQQYLSSSDFTRPSPLRMADFSQDDEEFARLQELSNKWESDATGPLVSERLSSSVITSEYANADPVYQAKTASLPQKYAQYRTCRGDGHCGWRAVAFSYFETLLRIGDTNKFLEEETRLMSMRNILNDAGFQEHLYEDFAEDTIDLLRETSTATDGGAALLQTFNDSNRAMSIITYLKLLTSAWMQKHPDQFQPYISQPVQSYCRSHIEPAVCEIEYVGMGALVDVLVKPAGIAVEILYLDRTPGDEVNTYRFDPVEQNPPTFRLLYRPGHYDILYKIEDLPQIALPPPMPAQQDLFVALNHASTEMTHQKIGFDLGSIEIPGMSFYTGPNVGWPAFQQYDFSPVCSQPLSPIRQVATPSYAALPSTASHAVEYFSHSVTVAPPTAATVTLPHHPAPHTPHASIDRGGPFRPSIWEYETNFAPVARHPALCQTAIFRNSHYNTAHFNNPEFEPEQWQPESDGQIDRPRKKSSHYQ